MLRALDGSNPLAFLAAVGTLRVLTLSVDGGVKMRWVRDGAWRPEVGGIDGAEDAVGELVYKAVNLPVGDFAMLGKDITVSPRKFEAFVRGCEDGMERGDRRAADFAVAFGSEVCEQPRDEERMQYTELCFMTGSGHQHFLGTIEELTKVVEVAHVQDALFGEWRKDKGRSMRWDPQDAAEYAMRWGDPSLEGASAVWGANLLAAEALPVFGAYPVRGGWLRTTGFRKEGDWPEFSWPIWNQWAGLDVVRSLVGLEELAVDRPNRAELGAVGVAEVYRAARVRIGRGANFKVSFRSAVAV